MIPFSIDLPADVPFAFSLQDLAVRLTTLLDHRNPRGVRYPLAAMLTIAILAKLAGYHRVEALADWARLRAADLVPLFGLAHPTMPHARTWGRIFAQAVDPVALDTLLGQFFQEQQITAEVPERGSIVLAVDGKTLRGTIPRGQTQGVHLVAAYLPDSGVVLAQCAVDSHTNEIRVVPQVLTSLDLSGVVVTGDALQTQRTVSAQIVEAGGDYLWLVKDKQPQLHTDLRQLFTPLPALPGTAADPLDFTSAATVDAAHGRLEERRIRVSSLLQDYSEWPYLAHVFKLERWVTDGLGHQTHEVRYGITSLPAPSATAHRLLAIARLAWGIENGLHYRRDVTLQEDASQLRRGWAPQVLAALNNTIVSLVAQHGWSNLAKAQREFAYGWDRAFAQRVAQRE